MQKIQTCFGKKQEDNADTDDEKPLRKRCSNLRTDLLSSPHTHRGMPGGEQQLPCHLNPPQMSTGAKYWLPQNQKHGQEASIHS